MLIITALFVIGGILLFIGILLMLHVTTYIHYTDDLRVKIRYGFLRIQIYPFKKKKRKKEKRAKKKDHQSIKYQQIDKKTAKEGFSLVRSAAEPVKDFAAHLKIKDVRVLILVGGEDASKTATKYAAVNSVVYTVLATVQNIVPVSVDRIRIQCDFLQEEMKFDIRGKVKVRAYHIIYTVCRILLRYIGNTLKKEKRTVRKKAEVSR